VESQPVPLQAVRLVREYRGLAVGTIQHLTPRMALQLLASGVAVEAAQGDMPAFQAAERAVAGPACEVRHAR
jgi:hypothetical protein